jgi:hypothetical protein
MYLFDMFLLRTQTRDINSGKQYIVDVIYVNTSQDPDPDPDPDPNFHVIPAHPKVW